MAEKKTRWKGLTIPTVLPLSGAAGDMTDRQDNEDGDEEMSRFKTPGPGVKADPASTQYAALCYRTDANGKTRVLLITSRDTGRWVLPKGWPVAGLSAPGSAAREAYEEAGVEGAVGDDCIGVYSYGKVLGPKKIVPCIVAVYPLLVTNLSARFPEKGQRQLRWFKPRAAAGKVAEPELAALLAAFHPARPDADQPDADQPYTAPLRAAPETPEGHSDR